LPAVRVEYLHFFIFAKRTYLFNNLTPTSMYYTI